MFCLPPHFLKHKQKERKMTEETEELFGIVFLICLILSSLALIGFANEKKVARDAVYSVARFVVVLLIGCLLPEPYNEYYLGVILVCCVCAFPFLYFGLTEIDKGKLQWVLTEPGTVPETKKKTVPAVTDPEAYLQIEKMAELKEKGVLSEQEFEHEKRRLLNI